MNLSHEVRRDGGGGGWGESTGRCFHALASVRQGDACTRLRPLSRVFWTEVRRGSDSTDLRVTLLVDVLRLDSVDREVNKHPRAAPM